MKCVGGNSFTGGNEMSSPRSEKSGIVSGAFLIQMQAESKACRVSSCQQQCVKCEVPALEQIAIDGRPFGKHDVGWLVADVLQRQGIAPNDVLFQG